MQDTETAVAAMTGNLISDFSLVIEDAIASIYGIAAAPETFIIDQSGKVACFHIGATDYDTLVSEIEGLLGR